MATGDIILTLTPLQYAEYQSTQNEMATLRANLTEAERHIAQLTEAVTEAAAVIDRYRAALEQYADRENWHMLTFNPGRETNWIGGGEGPDIAEKALASTTESEDR